MAAGHTDERIRKLAARGLDHETIARKIGRPGDVARVRRALRSDAPASPNAVQVPGHRYDAPDCTCSMHDALRWVVTPGCKAQARAEQELREQAALANEVIAEIIAEEKA